MRYISRKELVIPKRAKDAIKGDSGKVLVIGGSGDYVGALALAGIAALRAGVDWVTVAAPEKVGWAINALSPDLVVKKFGCRDFTEKFSAPLLQFEKNFDAVLIGNGLGLKAKGFANNYIKNSIKPLVIDADGIKAVGLQDCNNSILTPHHGELRVLLENSGISKETISSVSDKRIGIQKRAEKIGGILKKKFPSSKIVILLKGPIDAIISKNDIAYNKTGNPGMAKAGTGDVLAGLCAGFLGQGLSLFQSAVNAAYINGALGDLLLKKKKGYWFIASDLVKDREHICSSTYVLQ
ncbi:NAD(P)H-hydrate dehydratase [Candidatus Woesearchaeota archaeon]|nr:NAD(P)H-hydrate dehydratase [Candidatus Woesearchaeota archaeon]